MLGEGEMRCLNRFRRTELDSLLTFHFWGIDHGIQGTITNGKRLKALQKLIYYQEPGHRPQSLAELVDFERDAGPRLLNQRLEPRPLPISRFYPDPPHPAHSRLIIGYLRPPDIPSDISDLYVQQFYFPPWLVEGLLPSSFSNFPASNLGKAVGLTECALGVGTPKVVPVPWQPDAMDVATIDNNEGACIDSALDTTVVEAIERAVMRFAYKSLERHPSAFSRLARPSLTATTPHDLLKAVVGSFSATSRVALSGDVDQFDPQGTLYHYCGRGPVYRGSSSTVDAIIVAGMFLDAGLTVIDRTDGWENRFQKFEQAFIDAIGMNWDVYSAQVSADMRDLFWEILSKCVHVPDPNALLSMWLCCTENFAQFHFSHRDVLGGCDCRPDVEIFEQSSTFAAPSGREDINGVSMEELLARYFAPVDYCTGCGKQAFCRTVIQLPMRLVVSPGDPMRIRRHTGNVTFSYCDQHGQIQTATYRWIGGIYSKGTHRRVYWTDSERGERDQGEIRMYDSQVNLGLIVGGIPPAYPEDRVPAEWWQNVNDLPLLFYERVLNPSSEVLNSARASITRMVNMQRQNQLILQEHDPWTPLKAMEMIP